MASNVNNNIISEIEMVNTVDTKDTYEVEKQSTHVTPEEQDNINNMNANNQPSSPSNHTESDDYFNINNNHVAEEINVTNSIKTPTIGNNLNSCQSNGNGHIELIKVPENTEHVVIQDCDNSEDMSTSNALSDLMNTYSSDEDMFENFRSKPEFDDPKSEIEDCLSSSTSFLSIHESGSSSEEEPIACAPKKSNGVKLKSTRNKGELDLDDLPPIEDLQISVPEDQCLPVGKILNIVDTLVLIKSLKNTPTLDLDSVLFLEKGARTLGRIFDVIGPVCGPVYCVRFNSHQHIVDSNIHIDQDVYCAPQTEHTSYVPLPDLMKSKGSDASWEKDKEPPPEVIEFSDDEEERRVKRSVLRTRNNRNNQNQQSGAVEGGAAADTDGPREPKTQRPTPFEQRMNLRNLLMTASYERRSRLLDGVAATAGSPPRAPPTSIIRPPTLPDIPPLPVQQPAVTSQRFQSVPAPPPVAHPMSVFSPPPPLFHQNKKRPPTAHSPFQPPRFSPPPPMFPLPPPPLFNDPVLLFAHGQFNNHQQQFNSSPPQFNSNQQFNSTPQFNSSQQFNSQQPPPLFPLYSAAHAPPPPFQFGMPPLLGPRSTPPPPRYRQTVPPRPPTMVRPAFGARHRF